MSVPVCVTVTGMRTLIRGCVYCGESISEDRPARPVKYVERRRSTKHVWRRSFRGSEQFCLSCATATAPDLEAISTEALVRPLTPNPPSPTAQIDTCESCGVPLLLDRSARRKLVYCSNSCRQALYKASKPEPVERRCQWCEGPMTGRADRRYCSPRCRVAAHRAQHHVEDLIPDPAEREDITNVMGAVSDDVFEDALQRAVAQGDASLENIVRLLRETLQ